MRDNKREEKLNAMLDQFRNENEKAGAKDPDYYRRLAEFERLNSRNKSYDISSGAKGGRYNTYMNTDNYRNAHKRSNAAYNDLMTTIRIQQAKADERAARQGQAGSENKGAEGYSIPNAEKLDGRTNDLGKKVDLSKDKKEEGFAQRQPELERQGGAYRSSKADGLFGYDKNKQQRKTDYSDMRNAMLAKSVENGEKDDGYQKRLEEFERLNARNATYTFHGRNGMSVRRGGEISVGGAFDKGVKRFSSLAVGIATVLLGIFMIYLNVTRSNEYRKVKNECTFAVSAERVEKKSGKIYHTRSPATHYVDHIYSYSYENEEYTATWRVTQKYSGEEPPQKLNMFICPSDPSEYYIPQDKKKYSVSYTYSVIFIAAGSLIVFVVARRKRI